MSTPIRTALYRVIYEALIQIRHDAYESNSQWVFNLSDLLHTLPLSLERMERGEESPEEVMHWLQSRASARGLEQWLDVQVQEAMRHEGKERPDSTS